MSKRLRPPFKIHGGKFYLSDWIIGNLPKGYKNMTYVEPFCGGGSVFLNKQKSNHEILNDIDYSVYAIMLALRNTPNIFINRLRELEYKEEVFEKAKSTNDISDTIEFAINSYIRRRMSRGGLQKAFAWSERKRGGRPGDENAWMTMLDQLPIIADRIKDAEILNEDALEVISKYDNADTVFYCDPTYMPKTRQSPKAYNYEMTEDQHKQLAYKLCSCKSKVIISGYPSQQYDEWFADWKVIERKIVNHASQKKIKEYKTECLWINY